jgi:prepilin-type N-terminal cleavage/methylation domain-containing protein
MRARAAGFTLVELMAVVVIAAVLLVTVGKAMTREDNARATELWSQKVLVLMRQARATAVDSGGCTRVNFVSATRAQLEVASSLGICATNPTWILILREDAERGALVHAIVAGATEPAVTPAASAPSGAGVRFYPDGSADANTVYVKDASGKYQQKVVVWGLTGYSKLLTRW